MHHMQDAASRDIRRKKHNDRAASAPARKSGVLERQAGLVKRVARRPLRIWAASATAGLSGSSASSSCSTRMR